GVAGKPGRAELGEEEPRGEGGQGGRRVEAPRVVDEAPQEPGQRLENRPGGKAKEEGEGQKPLEEEVFPVARVDGPAELLPAKVAGVAFRGSEVHHGRDQGRGEDSVRQRGAGAGGGGAKPGGGGGGRGGEQGKG